MSQIASSHVLNASIKSTPQAHPSEASPAREKGRGGQPFASRLLAMENTARFPSRRSVAVLAIACVIAMAASGYLGWVALTSSKIAGCGGGRLFNCGHVISSRWSLWMGIPVSMLAAGLYVAMSGALFVGSNSRFNDSTRRLGWAVVSMLAISAGLAALWFISLQVFVLKHLCTYCLVAHGCGLVASAIVIWHRPIGLSGLGRVSLLSAAGVAVLIGSQLMSEDPKTYRIEQFEAPAAGEASEFSAPVFDAPVFDAPASSPATAEPTTSFKLPSSTEAKNMIAALLRPSSLLMAQVTTPTQEGPMQTASTASAGSKVAASGATPTAPAKRFVPINGGTVKLEVTQWPLSGTPSAKYIFAEMFDYSCPNCRHTHTGIKAARELLGGDLAVVVLPIPLNSACNDGIQVTGPKFAESCETAKLAVAIWRVDPAKFTEFHNWMFVGEEAPTYAVAKAHASTLVDTAKLNAELDSQVPAQYIAKTVELYKRAGSGSVPKLIFPTTTVVGEFTSGESLVEIVKQQIK